MPGTLTRAAITTDHAAYAARRPAERSRMIPLRRSRRIRVGDMLSFSFENAATLEYQVQEMVFTERLTEPTHVDHELEIYGRMLPTSHSLVATMLVELTDPLTVKSELARLDGLQRSVRIEVERQGAQGSPWTARGEEIAGTDEDLPETSALVSVHMLRFRFGDAARDAFRDPAVGASLVVDHHGYADDTPISGDLRTALLADLTLAG